MTGLGLVLLGLAVPSVWIRFGLPAMRRREIRNAPRVTYAVEFPGDRR